MSTNYVHYADQLILYMKVNSKLLFEGQGQTHIALFLNTWLYQY